MRLDELAAAYPQALARAVPDWTLGCFRRRCITYANGGEDPGTHVIWIQSHGMTGDLRIPADRPSVAHRAGLADCTREELEALSLVEGGVAATAFAGERMSWSGWCAFQPYDKWPEPGELRRIGTCLLEFAPSGIYVEDWRLQPSATTLLAGLRLVGESRDGGPLELRDGGLVVAGDHAILSLGRRRPLAGDAPLPAQMRTAADPAALAAAIFESVTSYARRDAAGAYRVELSTDPFAPSGAALPLDGFAAGDAPGLLVQSLVEDGRRLSRCWRIDTLLPDAPVPAATPAAASGLAWLARESGHLAGANA
jgi:hypothetical protein